MGDELLESEERWRETFEQAGAGMAHVSLDGRFLRVNQCLCELTGFTRDELLQKRPTDLCPQEDNAADLTQWQRLLANEIVEKRYLRKDGAIRSVEVAVSIRARSEWILRACRKWTPPLSAGRLIHCAESARLLGAQMIVSGVSREMAATPVNVNLKLGSIQTTGDLRRGIEEASRLLALRSANADKH